MVFFYLFIKKDILKQTCIPFYQAKKKTKKSKANKSSQNEDQSNPASDETLVNSSEGEYSDIGSDIKSSEDEEEDDEGEDEEDEEEDDVELDNPDNGRYMKFINLEDGESEYVRHPNCRLTKKGAIKFGIPPWLLHLYE